MSLHRFCVLALLAGPLSAAEPWTLPLFTADPHTVLAAAAKYAVSDDLNAFTIDYSVQVQIDPAGKLTKTTHSVTRVLRIPGINGARRVSVAWADWRENRPKIKARVITRDGLPHLLDESSMDETSGTQGSADAPGVKVLSAVLPGVDLDSIVELEIQESDREPGFPGARLGQVIPEAASPIGHFKLSISSSGAPVRIEPRGFPETTKVVSQSMGAAQLTTVEVSNFFPAASGALLPPEVAPRPTVTFTNVASWGTLAQWYAPMIEKAAAPQQKTAAPQQMARPTAADNQLSTVERVFEDFRKKVHDTGVPFGATPYTPRSPATDALQKTSGGSEDEAVLLISKLAEAGIPARAALISAEPNPDVVASLPGLEAFNRMLVYIGGAHPLWIDPSAEFTGVSRVALPDQGRWALILDPATTNLVRTPASTADDNRQILSTEIRLEDGADAKIAQTLEARGAFEDFLRALANSVNSADAEEKQNAQTQLMRIAGAQRITKTDAGDPHNLLTPARIELTAEGYPASQVGDNGGFIDLPGQVSTNLQRIAAALRSAATATASAGRKFDYFLPPAFTEERRYHVIPPAGFRFAEAPKLASLALGPLQLSATAKLEPDGSLRAEYTLVSPRARYTPQEVAAFGRDLSKVAGQQMLRVNFFNSAEGKLANGEFKEAISSFRERAAASPADTNVRLRLAAAYLTAGARSAAIKICTDILAKDPNNAAAYARLGWIYTHDEFGRPFRSGMNMAEAEKAYLKALEIDWKASYGIELATLYTYNSEGIRFGKSARLDDALQAYRQVGFDSLVRAGLINDYALTLLFAKKHGDLRQFFFYAQADRADQAFKLAVIAAANGENEAKDEATYAYPDPGKRKIALIEAARYLLTASEFEPAAALFNLAGPGQGISAAELALVRRAKPFDSSAASSQPAIAAFQRFISAVINPPDADAWKKCAGPELRDVSATRLRIALFQLLGGKQDPIYQPSSWPSLSDLFATALDFSVDGNGSTDFRIRVSDPARKGSQKTVAYVGKRGNEYLVLGLAGNASGSGEALTKAQNGDLPGARQWLDWAKDELPMTKVADPLAAPAFQQLWPPKSNDAMLIKVAAASVAIRAASYEPGLKALNELRPQISDPELQTVIDEALVQGLMAHQRFREALPVMEHLQTKLPDSKILTSYRVQARIATHEYSEASTLIDAMERAEPGTLVAMRLRERLLTEQEKFQEAAALETQICANSKASAFDWNDLAWIDLFAHADDKSMQQAAEKATELAGRSAEVLHTLALIQASTGQLKDARASGYQLMEIGAPFDESLTIFGRIAEQLDLPGVAADYYKRIPKPEGDPTLSTYAYAQMRLKAIAAAGSAPKLNGQ